MIVRTALVTLLALAALPAIAAAQQPAPAPEPTPAVVHGVSRAFMDTTCAACSDFFTFANGAWLRTAEIRPENSSAGAGREMNDRNQAALRRVLDEAAANVGKATDPTLKKLGAFYGACMDSSLADRMGMKPIASELAQIAAIGSRPAIAREVARLNGIGVLAPFYFGPEGDPKNSTMAIGQLYQNGLGLPDRDYYLKTDPSSDSLRTAYVAHVARVLELSGEPATAAAADARRVMRLETALARASLTKVDQRDPNKIYHKMSVAELSTLAPAIDWKAYFTAIGVPQLASNGASLDVSMPDFMKAVSAELGTAPLSDWKAYLRWQLVNTYANALGTKLSDEQFAFASRLSGAKQQLPRWKRCATSADNAMGEALGKAYAEREFTPQAKARALELVNNLQLAFAERIAKLDWMSDSTKLQARHKLDAILKKIAYPDTWRDYTAMRIEPGTAPAANLIEASRFETRRQFAKIGKSVDRMEWGMTPPTVNAYYNPSINEIVFPAGILAPPQFDPNADDAVNYGAIGMVIGHEMTHGFDDQGRQYDAAGNLKDWWTSEDGKRFDARAQRVVDQYNGYVAVDTFHVNGKLTLGENIADLGGITIAYYAYQKSLEGKPRPANIDGFTPEQRFFLGYAQAWRRKVRPQTLQLLVNTDPHSPAKFRVNGPLSNMPEFARAWGCKAGDQMIRPDDVRASIW